MQKIAASNRANWTFGKGFKFAAATVIIMMVFTVGTASAGTPERPP